MLTWNQARSGVYWDSQLALSQRGCFFWALLLYLDTLLSCRTPMWKQITGHSSTLWLSLAGCSRACCPHPSSGTTGRRRCFEDVFSPETCFSVSFLTMLPLMCAVTGIWPQSMLYSSRGRSEVRQPDSRGTRWDLFHIRCGQETWWGSWTLSKCLNGL